VLRERLGPKATLVAIDLLQMEPIAGVTMVQADFREPGGLSALEKALGDERADLVVSDMSPNLSGVEAADQARSVHLGELALDFAKARLQPEAISSSKRSRARDSWSFDVRWKRTLRRSTYGNPRRPGPEPRGVPGRQGPEKLRNIVDTAIRTGVVQRRRPVGTKLAASPPNG
jgi:23S rRNA U2552 (ribose-2'-O)-methylase RlmE/FtsJ